MNWIKWLIAGAIALFIPVILWNVLFLDYIDKHGKLIAWLLAPVFAAIFALVGVGYSKGPATKNGWIHPFWGMFTVMLVIQAVIVGFSNT